jgi:hypothetical protein
MNRRGIFFTVIALLVIAFLITYQQLSFPAPTAGGTDTAARSRVITMNDYAGAFETYALQSLSTSGYLALQNLSAQIRVQGAYLNDVNASIRYCLSNRTKDTNCMNASQTMNASLAQLIALAQTNLSITTQYVIHDVWISEEQPLQVVFWMNISYNISDPFARWNVQERILSTPVSVEGIEDPAFAYNNASGLVRTRTFSGTPFIRTQFDNASFTAFYLNQSYISNPGTNIPGSYQSAPSVLQRYTGRLLNGSSCCGIESVLRVQYITSATVNDPRIVNWSFIDYEFFSRTTIPVFNCAQLENAKLRNDAFADRLVRLDTYHFINVYNLTRYANYSCSP